MFIFSVRFPISLYSLNCSSSFLLSLWYLFKFITLSYHCLILLRGLSASISFLQITLFIPCLKSSTNGFFLYSLTFTTLLNSYTNFSVVLFSYSTFFNSVTFIVLLSFLLNSYLKSARNSPTITNTKMPVSRSFITSSFYISTDPPYIYNGTYCT